MTITIELGPAEIASGELLNVLQKMAAAEVATWAAPPPAFIPTEWGGENNAPEIPQQDETAEAKQKRVRRTKAQIEADEAAAKGIASNPPAEAAKTAEVIEMPKPETAKETAKVTKEMLSEAALKFTTENPARKHEFYAIRDSFKVKTITALDPAQYDAFYARLLALTSGATAAPAAAAAAEAEL